MTRQRPYIRLYESWKWETALLTQEEKGRLIDEVMEYHLTGKEKMPEGNERYIYPVIIERIKDQHETTERNRTKRKKERERSNHD